jgi:hypothetical protein
MSAIAHTQCTIQDDVHSCALSGSTDVDAATARILEGLKRWGVALGVHIAATRQCWSRMQLHARNKMRSQSTVYGAELGGQFPAFHAMA